MDRLRVATLNIWNRSGPWADRLRLIRGEIASLSPDVVGLQEVLLLGGDGAPAGEATWQAPGDEARPVNDQASAIAAGFGYSVAFASATAVGGGMHFGNALLSRFPVTEHRTIRLPGEASGEQRAVLYARLDHPSGSLPVFVTHLNWKLHHGSFRVEQVRFIVDRIMDLCPIDEGALPPVLMGDFNADPDSDEIRYLRGLATIGGRSVFFADAWIYGGNGGPGYTFDRKNRFAALSHEPPRRIDYIFVRGPDRQFRGEPLSTRLAFCEPSSGEDGEIWPSDHFGLVADLAVGPRDS